MSTTKKTHPEAPGLDVAVAKQAEHKPAATTTQAPTGETAPGSTTPPATPAPTPETKPDPKPAPGPAKNPADNESDVPMEALVVAVDAADAAFAHIGGSSRDWVEKAFLPALKDNHIVLKTFL